MSPEQGSGQKIDARSDIYSLGVVLYEMATGRVPYRAETPVAVVFKHVHDPLPPPRTLNRELPEAVERVILKALSKRPEDRYETAGHMVRALQLAIPESLVSQGSRVKHNAVRLRTPSPATPVPQLTPTLVPQAKVGAPLRTWGPIGVAVVAIAVGAAYWVYDTRAVPFDRPATSAPAAAIPTPASPATSARMPTATPFPFTPIPLPPEVLEANGQLLIGQGLLAANKRYGFEFQSGGNLVVHDVVTDEILWSSGTEGSQAAYLVLQDDGNLELHAKAGDPIWASDTHSQPGDYYLAMQTDGNLVIYRGKAFISESPVPIWATNTSQ